MLIIFFRARISLCIPVTTARNLLRPDTIAPSVTISTCASLATTTRAISTKWNGWDSILTTAARPRAQMLIILSRRANSPLLGVSSLWCTPASAAMPTADCPRATRWNGLWTTPRVASASTTAAVLSANSWLPFVAGTRNCVQRPSVLFLSALTSSKSCDSNSCSRGSRRLPWWDVEWPRWMLDRILVVWTERLVLER